MESDEDPRGVAGVLHKLDDRNHLGGDELIPERAHDSRTGPEASESMVLIRSGVRVHGVPMALAERGPPDPGNALSGLTVMTRVA